MPKIFWPNLFIVGAARSGSTALYDYLRQHPDIFMSPAKEPGFMAVDGALFDLENRHETKPSYFITSIESYRALFRHWQGEKIVGEATPHYLHDPRVPQRIHHYAPEARIVAILRSPAARAYSAFMMNVRSGTESRSFEEALMAAMTGPALPAMLAGSFYSAALARYRSYFGPDRLFVLLSDELSEDSTGCLQSLFRFLGVDPDFVPDTSVRPNRSGIPRSRLVQNLVDAVLDHRIMKRVHLYGPKGFGYRLEALRNRYYERGLDHLGLGKEAERFFNRSIFQRDILLTQSRLGRDLSHWLE